MKKLFLSLLLTPLLFAEIINGIAVTVDEETITLYDIRQEQTLTQLSTKETVDLLIRARLEQVEAKKRGLDVSNQEIIDDLNKMAAQNNMSLEQLYEAMSSARHLSEFQTKEKTKEKLLKQKLFDAIAMSKMDEATDEEVQEYYNLHLHEYQMPKFIDAVVYSSVDQSVLQQKIANPMMNISGIQTENVTLETAKINPRLAEILISTETGHFTPLLPQMGESGYMAFYLLSKNEPVTPELEQVRAQVENKIMQEKRDHILNEHFQRLRINADIKVLRLPE